MGTSLSTELKGKGVDVSVFAPGLTDTNMASGTGMDWSKIPMSMMSPEEAVSIALNGLGKKASIIPGFKNRMMYIMSKLFSLDTFSKINGMMIKKGLPKEKL